MLVEATTMNAKAAPAAGRSATRQRGGFRNLVLLGLGLTVGLIAQIYLLRRQYPLDGALFYIVAMVLFYLAVRHLPDAVRPSIAEARPYPLLRALPATALAAVGLVLLWQNKSNQGIVIIVLAFAALVAAYWRTGLSEIGKIRLARQEWLALAGILLVALLLRLFRLSEFPGTLYLDEGDVGLLALKVIRAKTYTPFLPDFTGHATFFFYVLGLYLKIVGIGIVTLRLFTIGIGMLAIVATYFLGRELLGARGALIAAFVMAISTWHITFSRVVFTGSTVPLFVSLTMFFLLRGLRTHQPLDFIWSGAALGLGLNTYIAFRVVPFLVVLYLAYKLIGNRSFLRIYGRGLILLTLAAIITVAPLGIYFHKNPHDFWSRTQAASVFLDIQREKSNAPLWANIRKAFGMFNYQGDPRPRHNLPLNPMLDAVSGIFFALGFGYAVLRWRKAENSMLVTWLALGMIPGVFSLADSNPHSLRTITNLPAVCLLAALGAERTLTFMQMHLSAQTNRRLAGVGLALAVVALALNSHTFFLRQATNRSVYYDFDPVYNAAALETINSYKTHRLYVAGAYTNHGAFKFLCDGLPYQTFNQTQHLPLRDIGDKDALFILEPVHRQLLTLFQAYYPDAQITTWNDRYGNLGFYKVNIKRDQIARSFGVAVSYYQGTDASGAVALERHTESVSADWATAAPLDPPFTAVWRGALYVARYGPHVLSIASSHPATVTLEGQQVLALESGQQSANLTLYGGFHNLQVMTTVGERVGSLRLSWRTPDGKEDTVPRNSLFALDLASNGLLGKYFRGNAWAGAPAIVQKDLFIFANDLLPAPFSIEWEGKIYAPQEGQYVFGTQSDDGSLLYINNRLVVDNGGHHSDRYVEGRVALTEGLHDIRLRYFQDDGGRNMELYWIPPGGRKDLVPPTVLFPPGTAISGPLAIATPVVPIQPPVKPIAPTTPGVRPPPTGPVSVGQLAPLLVIGRSGSGSGELRNPRGVAVDNQGNIYVADTGNKRVQKFDRAGTFLAEWKIAREALFDPSDVAIGPDGAVYVLEPERDGAQHFSADGQYRGRVGEGLGLYRPRDLTVDASNTLYFANTGGNNIVRASPSGQPLGAIGAAGKGVGQLDQPTGVALDASGTIYVADTYNQRVQRFTADGRFVAQWPIPAAGTALGPHIAVGPDGVVYVTDPDNHRFSAYSPEGALLATWGSQGSGDGQFVHPVGIYVDAAGLVYIADAGNDRVQVWGARQ